MLKKNWNWITFIIFSTFWQGYRLLKNGKLYGHIMGPDVNAVDITGISLGDRVVLQLVALTNHPVGKLERALLELERDESSPRQQGILMTHICVQFFHWLI